MGSYIRDEPVLEINPALNLDEIAAEFRMRKRVHVPHFMTAETAHVLYEHFEKRIRWRSFIVANAHQYEMPLDSNGVADLKGEHEITDFVHKSVLSGFTYWHDADRLFSDSSVASPGEPSELRRFAEEFQSGPFFEIARRITEQAAIARLEVRATRFRRGHFLTYHDGTRYEDLSHKRCASFEIQLTPHWNPDWGGLLAFREDEHGSLESYLPCFAALDIFAFPQGHWTSFVTPFADAPRYALSGSLYVK